MHKVKFEQNLIPIQVCDKYLPPNNHLYVEKKTGIVCSARIHSESEVKLGSEIDFHFNLSKASIFDPKTGNRLN